MVFGSDGSEPTHWKELSVTELEKFQKKFREGLFKATGRQDTWKQYQKSMTDCRNKYAVHREVLFTDPVQNFEMALAVVYYYDNWVRGIISPDTLAEPTLESFALSLQKTVVPLVEKLLKVTKEHG